MAQMFLGESSRRNQQIPESEMEDRWAMAFGPRKKQTCSECNEPVHETRDGICDKCRSALSNLTVETHTCVKCGNIVIRVNDLGLCSICNMIQSSEGPERYNGE